MRFVIVSFDGLRPDLVAPELTPNICRLQSLGVTLANHRTVYPSETRSAFPSLVTGTAPGRHGMVGNKYLDHSVMPPRYVDTSNAVLLRKLDVESGGRLMSSPSLGEILAATGLSMAILATNTPGTTRLFHHKAEDFGHVRLSGHFREACTPDHVLMEAEALIGRLAPAPPDGEPDRSGQDWITEAFLGLVWPKYRPDLTVLSYGEPDSTSHFHGTGAEATRAIIAHCDRQFGRVLDWWEAHGQAEGVQLIAMSDHGHITGHTRVSVIDSLQEAGFRTGTAPGPDVDVVVIPGQVGALYLSEPGNERIARLVATMTSQPWCGPVFTRAKNDVEGIAPGSLGHHLVLADHKRAPDVSFAFRADDRLDPFGLVGGTFYDSEFPRHLGVHGGLHRKELAALGIVAGSAFPASGTVSHLPTGICDLTPTILHIFGITGPDTMSGRVLHEVLAGGPEAQTSMQSQVFETNLGSFHQTLHRTLIGNTIYIDTASAESQMT